MTKSVFKRFSAISRGENKDFSDEYYTLYHAFMDLFIEVLCRYNAGKKYKVIICPCDSETSVFQELKNYKELIGNPHIIYSHWPEKDWKEYFDKDFKLEYGCEPDEVLIFTNPPFKGLSEALRKIRCDFLLFGSNAVSLKLGTFVKETGGFIYKKNNDTYTGNADDNVDKYGAVCTFFYSNKEFLSEGGVWTNLTDRVASILFGRDKLKRLK